MIDNKLAIYQAKQNFVDNLVRPCLMNADQDITDCRYKIEFHPKNADWVNETVTILFRNGTYKVINVCGDNLRGILIDIYKQGGLDEWAG